MALVSGLRPEGHNQAVIAETTVHAKKWISSSSRPPTGNARSLSQRQNQGNGGFFGANCPECFVVPGDSRVRINGFFNYRMVNGRPSYVTENSRASIRITFTGQELMVFGAAPGFKPETYPWGRYTFDGVRRALRVPETPNPFFGGLTDRLLFSARGLNTSLHSLSIDSFIIEAGQPFIFQYFFVVPHSSSNLPADTTATPPEENPPASSEPSDTSPTTTRTAPGGPQGTTGGSSSEENNEADTTVTLNFPSGSTFSNAPTSTGPSTDRTFLPSPSTTPYSSTPSFQPPPVGATKSANRLVVALIVMGVIIILASVGIGCWIKRRHMRNIRPWAMLRSDSRPESAGSIHHLPIQAPPVEAMRTVSRASSLTSPESIMRNDPVSLGRGSSAYSWSDNMSDTWRASASLEAYPQPMTVDSR